MNSIKAVNGKAVTDEMLDSWCNALDEDEWPKGWHNVGEIVEGKPSAKREKTKVLSVKITSGITKRPPHPGEFLREDYLPECGLTVASLAEHLGVSRQTANELVHERRSVSPDMALRLGRLFGTTPQYWLNLQRNVDLWDSLEKGGEVIEAVEPLTLPAA